MSWQCPSASPFSPAGSTRSGLCLVACSIHALAPLAPFDCRMRLALPFAMLRLPTGISITGAVSVPSFGHSVYNALRHQVPAVRRVEEPETLRSHSLCCPRRSFPFWLSGQPLSFPRWIPLPSSAFRCRTGLLPYAATSTTSPPRPVPSGMPPSKWCSSLNLPNSPVSAQGPVPSVAHCHVRG